LKTASRGPKSAVVLAFGEGGADWASEVGRCQRIELKPNRFPSVSRQSETQPNEPMENFGRTTVPCAATVLDAPCVSLTALARRPALLISVAIGARVAFVVALLFMTGCAKNERLAPEPVAVGTSLGGGSWLFGASGCTYDAPASVAELSTNDKGARFRATLVGEGSVTETCANWRTIYRVRKATALRIVSPTYLPVGDNDHVNEDFSVVPRAQTEPLQALRQGGEAPQWDLGDDCAGVARFGPALGNSDTGGASIRRRLIGLDAGTCTVRASALGVSESTVVVIQTAK
jgi:hypothetical protein